MCGRRARRRRVSGRRGRRPRRSRARARRRRARARACVCVARSRARAGSRAPARARSAVSRALREESASPSASRTVSTTRISTSRLRSRTSCFRTATCCASFRPNHAICGRTMLNSFRQTVATPRKWPGRCAPSSPSAAPSRLDPRREAGRVHLRRRAARRGRRRRGLGARRVGARGRAGTRRGRPSSENCAGLTNRLATSTSQSGARGGEERGVAAVQRAHRRHEPDDAVPRQVELGDRAHDDHGARRLRERARRAARARRRAERREVTVDGLPVAARDRPGQLEAVLDRPLHQRARAPPAARPPRSKSCAAAR